MCHADASLLPTLSTALSRHLGRRPSKLPCLTRCWAGKDASGVRGRAAIGYRGQSTDASHIDGPAAVRQSATRSFLQVMSSVSSCSLPVSAGSAMCALESRAHLYEVRPRTLTLSAMAATPAVFWADGVLRQKSLCYGAAMQTLLGSPLHQAALVKGSASRRG